VTVRQHTRKGGSGQKQDRSQRGIGGKIRSLLASRRARRQPEQESWWADPEQRQAAKAELRASRDALEENSQREQKAGIKDETEAYHAANLRVIRAEENIKRGRRGDAALPPMLDEMRTWHARPEPRPSPATPMTPQLAKCLGADTPEGLERYERGRAYREAGYLGPLDSGNRIPDPDDPANYEMLHALAALGE
jgi:hypothetical protein